MQVRSGDTTGRADLANHLAGQDSLAFLNAYFTQVTVHRHVALTVIKNDGVAIEKVITGSGNDTREGRRDRPEPRGCH